MKPQIIQSIGVSEKASVVYLAALSLGTASVQKISRAAKMKRSSVYGYIDELMRARLLEKIPIGKREYYRSVDPQQIEEKLKQQLATFQNYLPDLINLRNKSTARPRVQLLEGRDGVLQIYKECVEYPFIRAFSYLPDIENIFPNEVQTLGEKMQKEGIRLHEIMPDKPSTRQTARRFGAVAGSLYEARMIDGQVHNDMLIYGNVLAILRIHELDLFVVRVEDDSITTSMRTLFDTAWDGAQQYYPQRKK